MQTTIQFHPIGTIYTSFQDPENTPIQSSRSETAGTVEVLPEYLDGLDGIEDFSHLILIYAFHRASEQVALKVKPFLDDQVRGLFTTRYPIRPNPIGISVVKLVARHENRLDFLGADMLNGTPLLDIKPYVPDFDIHTVSKTRWYENRAHP